MSQFLAVFFADAPLKDMMVSVANTNLINVNRYLIISSEIYAWTGQMIIIKNKSKKINPAISDSVGFWMMLLKFDFQNRIERSGTQVALFTFAKKIPRRISPFVSYINLTV